ncbi:MAG: glycosyltransferase [Gemmatimonadetes bacterium]|nr:glycosyltransferase [Gemmatimonadota bacterium]
MLAPTNGSNASGKRNTVTDHDGRSSRPKRARAIKVVHLIACCMTDHGPSSGIVAQVKAQTPGSIDTEVWSMYAPPHDRDPTAMLAEVGARHVSLGGSRHFIDPWTLMLLINRLRQTTPDIVHGHLVRANLYAAATAPFAGRPAVICTMRGIEQYLQGSDVTSRVVRAVERRLNGNVSRYVAVSNAVRSAVVRLLGVSEEQTVTILNAVDLEPFTRVPDRAVMRASIGIDLDATVIATVGVLEAHKNLDAFLHAIAAIRHLRDGHKVVGVIVGEGSQRARLEQLTGSLGLASSVRFLGMRSDVTQLLPSFDIFALPSFGEGLSRAIMEAMASGLPCVVYDVGGNREAVTNGQEGFVHSLLEPEAFAASICQLVEDEALRQRMGTAAKTAAFERFSPTRLAREYQALYDEVLCEPRPSAHA